MEAGQAFGAVVRTSPGMSTSDIRIQLLVSLDSSFLVMQGLGCRCWLQHLHPFHTGRYSRIELLAPGWRLAQP